MSKACAKLCHLCRYSWWPTVVLVELFIETSGGGHPCRYRVPYWGFLAWGRPCVGVQFNTAVFRQCMSRWGTGAWNSTLAPSWVRSHGNARSSWWCRPRDPQRSRPALTDSRFSSLAWSDWWFVSIFARFSIFDFLLCSSSGIFRVLVQFYFLFLSLANCTSEDTNLGQDRNVHFTSAKEVLFHPAFVSLSVCLCVFLFVCYRLHVKLLIILREHFAKDITYLWTRKNYIDFRIILIWIRI